MIVLIGESGSGKTTLCNNLTSQHDFRKAVSCTTRQPREGEQEGKDYFFLSKEEFKQKIKLKERIPTHLHGLLEYTEYNGNYYGLIRSQARKKNCIAIVEPDGLKQIKNTLSALKKADSIPLIVFYLYASPEVRKERLIKRGDSLEDIEKRLALDKEKFKDIEWEADYCICVNNLTPEEVTKKFMQIIDIYELSFEEDPEEEIEEKEEKVTIPKEKSKRGRPRKEK